MIIFQLSIKNLINRLKLNIFGLIQYCGLKKLSIDLILEAGRSYTQ